MATYTLEVTSIMASRREDTGAVLVQTGDVVSQKPHDHNCVVWGPGGWVSVAAPAVPSGRGTEALVAKTGGADWIVGVRDLRAAEVLGRLDEGEACGFAPLGQASIQLKKDGSAVLFTTNDNLNGENSKNVFLGVAPNGWIFSSPYGKLTFGQLGCHILTASGARLDMGALTVPGIPDALNSNCTLSAQTVRIEGAAVHIGTVAGVPEPIAKGTSTAAYLTGLEGALNAFAAALGTGTGPVTAANAALAATALATAISGLQALKVSLNSTAATVT